ncbi:unnamed protein product [Malus baccata var. baccata]
MDGGHLCVCVCGFLLSGGHMTHSIFPTTFTIIICILFRPWMVVSFKTVCRYCFKRWSIRAIVIFFQTIPYPFQSLNTKGSIFKVSLQTYIYIIVIYTTTFDKKKIYTTTNKFVWTHMLIFLSN